MFNKALPEKKMLDSSYRFPVELLTLNGEIMFCKRFKWGCHTTARQTDVKNQLKLPIGYLTSIGRAESFLDVNKQ